MGFSRNPIFPNGDPPLGLFTGQCASERFTVGAPERGHNLPGEFIAYRVFFIDHKRGAGCQQIGTCNVVAASGDDNGLGREKTNVADNLTGRTGIGHCDHHQAGVLEADMRYGLAAGGVHHVNRQAPGPCDGRTLGV